MDAEREQIAQKIERLAYNYPVDIFIPPEPGQHGKTVDGCAAQTLRVYLPIIAEMVRDMDIVRDADSTQLDVIQTNHDNLRTQNDSLLKQARAMAAILRAVAGGDDCQVSAVELLAKYADEIKF